MSPSFMKAISIKDEHGPADNLFIDSKVATPTLREDEALVKVKAFALNRMDLTQRAVGYIIPPGASEILGVDYSGVIEEIHPELEGKTKFKVGDRVFGLVTGGAYAEYVAAPVETMIKLPEQLSFTEGASYPEVWFTATQVVKLVGQIKKNDAVLFHGGASAVGIGAIQIAQLLGARRVFATVGSDEKKEFLKSKLTLAGSKEDTVIAINYHTENFTKVVKKYEPSGIDLIIDPVGSTYFSRNIDLLEIDSRLVVMGLMGGAKSDIDLSQVLRKRIAVLGTTLRNRGPEYQSSIRDIFEELLLPGLLKKELYQSIDRVFNWTDIVEAHKLMESNKTMGKIVVLTE